MALICALPCFAQIKTQVMDLSVAWLVKNVTIEDPQGEDASNAIIVKNLPNLDPSKIYVLTPKRMIEGAYNITARLPIPYQKQAHEISLEGFVKWDGTHKGQLSQYALLELVRPKENEIAKKIYDEGAKTLGFALSLDHSSELESAINSFAKIAFNEELDEKIDFKTGRFFKQRLLYKGAHPLYYNPIFLTKEKLHASELGKPLLNIKGQLLAICQHGMYEDYAVYESVDLLLKASRESLFFKKAISVNQWKGMVEDSLQNNLYTIMFDEELLHSDTMIKSNHYPILFSQALKLFLRPEKKDKDEAYRLFRKVDKMLPNNFFVLIEQAQNLVKRQEIEEAKKIFNLLTKNHPEFKSLILDVQNALDLLDPKIKRMKL